MMIIHYVNPAHQTNSSSAHSLIWLPKDHQAQGDDYDSEWGFGREVFTLATETAKKNYLAVLLDMNLAKAGFGQAIRDSLLRDWVGVTIKPTQSYIDHQSFIALPFAYGSNGPDREFFDSFQKIALAQNVVIGGGDDEDSHHPLHQAKGIEYIFLNGSGISDFDTAGVMVVRKDETQDFWTLYNQRTGAKIRFSFEPFDGFANSIHPTRASTPELVDISLTDFCGTNCSFCYRGSDENGQHANTSIVFRVLDALADMKVFEVAIGGGEAMQHPDFLDIIQHARELGIVPNLTTRNIEWLYDPAVCQPIMNTLGSFAYSIGHEKQIVKLATALDYAGCDHKRVNVHVVMGTVERYRYGNILEEAKKHNFRVTLLGYKTTGRGINYQPIPYAEWWLKDYAVLRKLNKAPLLFIDTVLAKNTNLRQYGVHPASYHTVDGAFSAFIDLVKQTMSPSSYEDETGVFFGNSRDLATDLRHIFRSFAVHEQRGSHAKS